MVRFTTCFALALATATFVTGALAGEATPRVNENGLRLVADRDLDTVYVDTGTRVSGYDALFVQTPTVRFKENWARDFNRQQPGTRIYPEDEEKLVSDYTELTERVFRETLEKRGFKLSEQPGEGVLVVRPDIVDLDIVAPDIQRAARVERYSQSAGEMTLALTLADGASGRPLVQVSDHKEDPRWDYMEWRTRPSNVADAKRALRGWANTLGDALEEGRW